MIDEKIAQKIKSGALITVTEKIKEKEKERSSSFKGVVIARKHGSQSGATFTVRAVIGGIGVERVFPLHSPSIVSVKISSSPKKVRRSKLYFLRKVSKKKSRQTIGVAA